MSNNNLPTIIIKGLNESDTISLNWIQNALLQNIRTLKILWTIILIGVLIAILLKVLKVYKHKNNRV